MSPFRGLALQRKSIVLSGSKDDDVRNGRSAGGGGGAEELERGSLELSFRLITHRNTEDERMMGVPRSVSQGIVSNW